MPKILPVTEKNNCLKLKSCTALLLLCFSLPSPYATALEFKIKYHESIPDDIRPKVISVFTKATKQWKKYLKDDLTVTFAVKWVESFENPKEGGGRASVYYMPVDYAEVRTALIKKASSKIDFSSTESLEEELRILMNRTSDNPNGEGSSKPYLDANDDVNNTVMRLPLGNARVLGLYPQDLKDFDDGKITMSGRPNWDFDRSDGITLGKADFYAVALHEIGHLLGMSSLIDSRLSKNPGKPSASYPFLTPLDLFRYSEASAKENAVDWSSDDRIKYLSADGGLSQIANFATGLFGDLRDPSHWGDDEKILGIFEAEIWPMQNIELPDIKALDMVGWDVDYSSFKEEAKFSDQAE